MSGWLIAITGLIYLYIAFEMFFIRGNTNIAIVYFGYAFSNIGLYLAAMR